MANVVDLLTDIILTVLEPWVFSIQIYQLYADTYPREVKMVIKLLLKNKQASSTEGMRSISFQDTRARSIKKGLLTEVF